MAISSNEMQQALLEELKQVVMMENEGASITLDTYVKPKLDEIRRLYIQLSGPREGWAEIMMANLIREEIHRIQSDWRGTLSAFRSSNNKSLSIRRRLDNALEELRQIVSTRIYGPRVVDALGREEPLITNQCHLRRLRKELKKFSVNEGEITLDVVFMEKLRKIKALEMQLNELKYHQPKLELVEQTIESIIEVERFRMKEDAAYSVEDFLMPDEKFKAMLARLEQRIKDAEELVKKYQIPVTGTTPHSFWLPNVELRQGSAVERYPVYNKEGIEHFKMIKRFYTEQNVSGNDSAPEPLIINEHKLMKELRKIYVNEGEKSLGVIFEERILKIKELEGKLNELQCQSPRPKLVESTLNSILVVERMKMTEEASYSIRDTLFPDDKFKVMLGRLEQRIVGLEKQINDTQSSLQQNAYTDLDAHSIAPPLEKDSQDIRFLLEELERELDEWQPLPQQKQCTPSVSDVSLEESIAKDNSDLDSLLSEREKASHSLDCELGHNREQVKALEPVTTPQSLPRAIRLSSSLNTFFSFDSTRSSPNLTHHSLNGGTSTGSLTRRSLVAKLGTT